MSEAFFLILPRRGRESRVGNTKIYRETSWVEIDYVQHHRESTVIG